MTLTKDSQVKEVVIGMALGALMQGVEAVTGNKTAFEFGFNHAWRQWGKAKHFPGIKGHDPGNLFWIGVCKSERRKGACAARRRRAEGRAGSRARGTARRAALRATT